MTTSLLRMTALAAILTAALLTATDASAQETSGFDIAPGPLDRALNAFGQASGVTVLYDTNLTADLVSQGVSGAISDKAALTALLAGTGLSHRNAGPGAVTLERTALGDAGPIQLDQILVQGELQTRTIQDTTTSVAVIRGEDLERRPDDDVFDVIERTAGVSNGSPERIAIRGVNAAGLGGGEPVISTRIDGAVVDAGRFAFNALQSTWDLEQIEVSGARNRHNPVETLWQVPSRSARRTLSSKQNSRREHRSETPAP